MIGLANTRRSFSLINAGLLASFSRFGAVGIRLGDHGLWIGSWTQVLDPESRGGRNREPDR